MADLTKPTRLDRTRAQAKRRRAVAAHERAEKAKVRARDQTCRFPLCNCHGQPLEVAHLVHKGMGGDKRGVRSTTQNMILLCRARHQGPLWSLHRGNVAVTPVTESGCDGPVAWSVRLDNLDNARWVTVAVERPLRPAAGVGWGSEFTGYRRVLRLIAEELA